MGQIRLNRNELPKLTSPGGQSTITFNSNSVVGNVPLLKLFNTYSGSNDYFHANMQRGTTDSVRGMVDFQSGRRVISVRRNMRSYDHRNNPKCTISTSMLSILGIQGEVNTLFSKGLVRERFGSSIIRTVLITNPVDVFVLAMIKPSDVNKIETNRYYVEFDSSIITLYVSEEKWKKRMFLEENYNKTLVKYLRSSVKRFTDDFGVKTEVVPDEMLATYYRNPHSIENNSISEIMEIDKQIKDKVFSKISDNLLVDV